MTPAENALVAYAILEQVDADREGGVAPEFLALDVARAQVYATLATVKAPPTQRAISEAIQAVLVADGMTEVADIPWDAAEAVGRLL